MAGDRSRPRRRPRLVRRVASSGNGMPSAIGTGLFVHLDAR
jgi:hypothetical protein